MMQGISCTVYRTAVVAYCVQEVMEMFFKNEKSEIEILIGGYTDTPECFEESIGKNALSCQVSYFGEELGYGVLWDELFQTDDIVRLYNMAIQLANGKVDSFLYKDQWNMVLINAEKGIDNYQIEVSIIQRDSGNYLSGKFVYSKPEFADFIEELKNYKEAYPARA